MNLYKKTIQSPTRVDLSGGTLDLWPLYILVGDCYTINLSIDVMTEATLIENKGSEININVADLNYEKEFGDINQFLESKDDELILIKSIVSYFMPQKGFKLSTKSQSPVGGGLGGSSSLTISILQNFCLWLGLKMNDSDFVNLAANMEAEVLKTPTGIQDYYPAFKQGLGVISLSKAGHKQQLIDFDYEYFDERMFLVNTGRSHHSGINNWDVYKNVIDGNKNVIDSLCEIKNISLKMNETLKLKKYRGLPELFNKEFNARVKLSESFTSPEIEKIKKILLNENVLGVKILGAGGGGCMLVLCEPKERKRLMELCEASNYDVIGIKSVHGPKKV